jgi:hypothetical protein
MEQQVHGKLAAAAAATNLQKVLSNRMQQSRQCSARVGSGAEPAADKHLCADHGTTM